MASQLAVSLVPLLSFLYHKTEGVQVEISELQNENIVTLAVESLKFWQYDALIFIRYPISHQSFL